MFLPPFFSLRSVFSFVSLVCCTPPKRSHSQDSLNALHDIWLDEYTHAPEDDTLAVIRPQHLMQVLKPRLHGSYADQEHMFTINVQHATQSFLHVAWSCLRIPHIKQCIRHQKYLMTTVHKTAIVSDRACSTKVATACRLCSCTGKVPHMRRSLAIANSQLLPHTILVNVLLQQREVVTQRSLTLLANVVHIHGGVGSHDRRKLGCLAVLQGQLAHQTHIPAVAQLNPNPAERERLHDTTSSQLVQHVCCLMIDLAEL